jgi:hypothetical protein
MEPAAVLAEVAEGAGRAFRNGRLPVAVFDLDDTLFHNSPRTQRILREILIEDSSGPPQFPPEFRAAVLEALAAIGPLGFEYAVASTLRAHGVPAGPGLDRLMLEWKPRFFSDLYMEEDRPIDGASDAVRALHAGGCVISYVSGRHVGGMLQGTVRSLETHRFPVGCVGTELLLKPRIEVEDDAFKRDACVYLARRGPVVAVFENDPRQLNTYLAVFPEATGVWLDTRRPPDSPPPDPRARAIRSFANAA